ncbi:alpha-N-acetylgalactosaminide alpha-2,6-sialyltransferase 2 isoform X1 [Epinephelus lanceolatus]|uniref:alpha-N-acetylgalactosaminide alpha-2,6-sialyltransferase 2 n=1 Tax=Epinephelus lanceolatus TaxID=310571 RepID=UPI0014466800|nr:alpha-N-acetylgalactosaminide alpha-2,6-sialyltransferase 2 [Epinephelus lanceolatus]
MKASMKCVFLLLGIFSFIVCIFLYSQHVSDLKPDSMQTVDWSLILAGEQEEGVKEVEEVEKEDTGEAACSLRKAVMNSVVLREKFSFSVPVIQWAKSFSKPAWQLLKRKPPYGWKGLPLEVVRSTLSLLNSSSLFKRGSPGRCVRCAVVGNGGILRGSRQGKNIDSHDFVFRVNGAVIKGYEEDVGTKISFFGFTTNTMKNALHMYQSDGFTKVPQSPEIKYIFIPSNLRDYVMLAAAVQRKTVRSGRDRGDMPWQYFGHKPPGNFKILHPSFIHYVTHSFLPSPLLTFAPDHYMPTTGALMLMTALHTCDQVSAYGFITRNYNMFSDHYYDSIRKPLMFYSNHDMPMERRLWEFLNKRGVIRLYQRGHS